MKKNIEQCQNKDSITIGYARVSSTDNRQELGLSVQTEALKFCDKLYIEKDSGGNQERPQLKKAMKIAKKYAQQGVKTNFVVYKLDRLTRKMLHLSTIIEDLPNTVFIFNQFMKILKQIL